MSGWEELPVVGEPLRADQWGYYVNPHRAAAAAYVAQALRDVIADPITIGGVTHLGIGHLPGILAAESHVAGRHARGLRVTRHSSQPREIVTYHSPRRRREVADAMADHILRMQARAPAYLARIHEVCDQIMGILPVYDSEGRELVDGVPQWTSHASAERRRLYREDLCDLVGAYRDPDRRGARAIIDPARRAALLRTTTAWDAPVHMISTDVPTARDQLIDRLDVAAADRRRYLLDSDVEDASPANAGQATALRLLESRRQAGRRALRACATVAALTTAADTALTRIRGVAVEDAPVWQSSSGVAISGGTLSVSYTAPTTGRWTHGLRAAGPGVGADKSVADLGDVVLDDPDTPPGWTVTSTPRAAPAAHERDVTIAWAGTGAPDAGTYTLTVTARNACGPASLTVTITVPAAAD